MMKLLETKKVTIGYDKEAIVENVSLSLEEGQCISILGQNGTGKTTFLNAIAGFLPVWSGEIYLFQNICNNYSTWERIRMGLAYVMQTEKIFPKFTVRENIQIAIRHIEKKKRTSFYHDVIKYTDIFNNRLNSRSDLLSGGEQQILALLRALAPKPKLLLLDEPSAGLSVENIEMFKSILLDYLSCGNCILMVEQNIDFSSHISSFQYELNEL